MRRDGHLAEEQAGALLEDSASGASAEILVEPFHDDQQRLLGLDLSVAAGQPDAAERLCQRAFKLADTHALKVYDPQLGYFVAPEDQATVAQSVAQTAQYMSEIRLGMTPEQLQAKRPGPLVWYVVAGFIALVVLVGQLSTCLP